MLVCLSCAKNDNKGSYKASNGIQRALTQRLPLTHQLKGITGQTDLTKKMEHAHCCTRRAILTLFFVLAVALQHRTNLCWSAPVQSASEPAAAAAATEEDMATNSMFEQQGEEIADLQELRSGLKVLKTIVVSEYVS